VHDVQIENRAGVRLLRPREKTLVVAFDLTVTRIDKAACRILFAFCSPSGNMAV
jgi:hypothetical protein